MNGYTVFSYSKNADVFKRLVFDDNVVDWKQEILFAGNDVLSVVLPAQSCGYFITSSNPRTRIIPITKPLNFGVSADRR